MPRRVFYSFDYEHDCWRAAIIRNIGVIQGKRPMHDNRWEAVDRGNDEAIKRWIDQQLRGRSCTIILIGTHTAHCRWVQYEIERSWALGKGLLGIRIHQLLDQHQQASEPGPNPFDAVMLPDGKKLSSVVTAYAPKGETSAEVYAYISQHIERWIEDAIAARSGISSGNADSPASS